MTSFMWLLAVFALGAAALKYRLPGEVSLAEDIDTDGSAMKTMVPFYHTSAELRSEMTRLASSCAGASFSLDTVKQDDVSIDTVHVRGKDAQPVNRVFVMCGEHSRELISSESCLHFLKQLCGEVESQEGSPTAQEVLLHSEFQVVLNANPRSRLTVESGEYCVRENPQGVDLNRNWDEHFEHESVMPDTFPGLSPFSETETQLHKELVTKFKPDTYLSIHSGTLGMYMPWAYDMVHLAKRNQEPMMDVLRAVDKKHCHCPYGAAGREVGYPCPGTSIDYVYDKLNASFSFAFEIWVPPDQKSAMESRWKSITESDTARLLQSGEHHLAHPHYASFFQEHASDFVQVRDHKSRSDTQVACFNTYNPETKAQYDQTVQTWAAVFLETADLISRKLQGEGAGRKSDYAII